MLKIIISAIVSLGISAIAFAEGTEGTPAPTGTETPAAPKAPTAPAKKTTTKHTKKGDAKKTTTKAE
jgi:hypothetical protein